MHILHFPKNEAFCQLYTTFREGRVVSTDRAPSIAPGEFGPSDQFWGLGKSSFDKASMSAKSCNLPEARLFPMRCCRERTPNVAVGCQSMGADNEELNLVFAECGQQIFEVLAL